MFHEHHFLFSSSLINGHIAPFNLEFLLFFLKDTFFDGVGSLSLLILITTVGNKFTMFNIKMSFSSLIMVLMTLCYHE